MPTVVPVALRSTSRRDNRLTGGHPTTSELIYTPEEMAFCRAIDDYKKSRRRPFPAWSEVLAIAKALGYRKVAPEEPMTEKSQKIADIWKNLGADATYGQVMDAADKAGVEQVSRPTFTNIRHEIWPQNGHAPPATRVTAPAAGMSPADAFAGLDAVRGAIRTCGGWDNFRRIVAALEAARD